MSATCPDRSTVQEGSPPLLLDWRRGPIPPPNLPLYQTLGWDCRNASLLAEQSAEVIFPVRDRGLCLMVTPFAASPLPPPTSHPPLLNAGVAAGRKELVGGSANRYISPQDEDHRWQSLPPHCPVTCDWDVADCGTGWAVGLLVTHGRCIFPKI